LDDASSTRVEKPSISARPFRLDATSSTSVERQPGHFHPLSGGHQFVFKSKKKPGARAPARAAPPVDTEAEARLKDQVARLEREAREAADAREAREKLSQRRAALLQCVFRMRGEGILDAEAWARFLAPGGAELEATIPRQASRGSHTFEQNCRPRTLSSGSPCATTSRSGPATSRGPCACRGASTA